MDPFKTLIIGTPPSRTYTGSAVGLLTAANNLSDVADAQTSLNNLTASANLNLAGATSSIVLGAATETLTIAVTAAGAGTITPKSGQQISVAGPIRFTTNATSPGSGSITKDATYGLNLYAATGSNYDFAIFNAAGNSLMLNPPGTQTVVFPGITQVTNTTDSTTKDTGALVVEGGLGVEKSINAGLGIAARGEFASLPAAWTGEYGLGLENKVATSEHFVRIGDGSGYTLKFLKRTSSTDTTVATLTDNGALTLAGALTTSAPTGGAGAWELGVANSVSPTSPNRTLTVEIGGTVYYIHAKTTND